jgi:hypothetical protein
MHDTTLSFFIVVEMGLSQTFCPDGPKTTILLISVFQVPRITGVSH